MEEEYTHVERNGEKVKLHKKHFGGKAIRKVAMKKTSDRITRGLSGIEKQASKISSGFHKRAVAPKPHQRSYELRGGTIYPKSKKKRSRNTYMVGKQKYTIINGVAYPVGTVMPRKRAYQKRYIKPKKKYQKKRKPPAFNPFGGQW